MRSLVAIYGASLGVLAVALVMRWLLDPVLDGSLPLVTLFGAVAFAVWAGGYRSAVLVTVLGFTVCDYFFIEPRHAFGLRNAVNGVGALAYLLTCSVIIALGEGMRVAAHRARYERERVIVTLSSIGDAVITTDPEGRVTFLNPIAETLTGWTQHDAGGRPLDDVFHIVNEETRHPAPNPVVRALREGTVVGLANHTVLIRKDGAEIPIDDSAAPIRSEARDVLGCVLVFRNITDRRRAESERARLAAIVDSSDDAIVGKTLDGVVTSWNRGAVHIFGYTADEMIGQPIARLIPPELQADFAKILESIRRGERIEHFETERMRKDGTRIYVSLSVSPIQDAHGRIFGAAKVARDVTDRIRAEKEREDLLSTAERARAEAEAAAVAEHGAREAAEAASRAKDAFLATVSHELRTPLSPILTWARMLRQTPPNPEKSARGLEVIERCARTQAQLIEDLLDVSSIVAGKMRLAVRPVSLAPVIERAVEILRLAAEAKSIRLQTVLDTEVGAVSGDAERLQQVVWNLLANAVKFTPKGGRVHVVLERVNSHIEIAVSDTGEGIAPEFLPYVFERFQQADGGTTRIHGGLGLGLAIVRHIVEAHGGTVHVESSGIGQGAVFTVKLPLMMARIAGETDRRHPAAGIGGGGADELPRLHGLRILIVDDEPDSNEAVGNLLISCGAEVRAAISSEHARSILDAWEADLLVSDVGMPGEDGYALIAKLRASDGERARIPAVALTAYASREDKVRLLSAGFQAHVPKPLDPDELIAVITSLRRTV